MFTFIIFPTNFYKQVNLVARCHYFSTIFSSGFRESGESVISLKEISSSNFVSLLHFIYGNELHGINSDNVVDILMAADRFLLEELKEV